MTLLKANYHFVYTVICFNTIDVVCTYGKFLKIVLNFIFGLMTTKGLRKTFVSVTHVFIKTVYKAL